MVTPLRYDDFRRILRGMARNGSVHEVPQMVRDGWTSWDQNWPDDCAKFVLDDADIYDSDLLDFGLQMAAHNVLAMPASAFFIQWRHDVTIDRHGVPTTEVQDSALFVLVLQDGGGVLKIGMMHGAIRRGEQGLNFPVAIDLYGQKAADILNGKENSWGDVDLVIATNLRELLTFLALLSAKDIIKEPHRPNERLQVKRAKKGLPPLPAFVRLKVPGTLVERERQAAGVDRSSPRPHFRRGHIRLIYKGTEKQRVVAVAPSLVNASRGAVEIRPYKLQS